MNLEDIMKYNEPYNEQNLNRLIKKIKSDHVVPYIGAGMSMLFEGAYPSWNGFLESTLSAYKLDEKRETFNSFNNEQKADFLYAEVGNITFADHLKETFSEKHLNRDAMEFTSKPIYLVPVIFGKGLIITTNYDKAIEKVYGLHEEIFSVAHPGHFEALNRALREQLLLIFKIHGDISEPQTSIILNKEQYDRAYANEALIQTLKQAFLSKEMLFLGCSLTKDKPIELMCNILTEGMRNFAIVSCNNEDIKSKRLQLEKEFYTQAILYPEGKHESLNVLLSHIAQEINPDAYEKAITKYNGSEIHNVCIELDDEWFIGQNDIQIRNLGDRYLPDLNIKLDLSNVFNGMNRNVTFQERLTEKTDITLVALNDTSIEEIKKLSISIRDSVISFDTNTIEDFCYRDVIQVCNQVLTILDDELKKLSDKLHQSDSKKNENAIQTTTNKYNHAYNSLDDYIAYLNTEEVSAVNNPYIFLYGEGGIGKSHIIADTIRKREKEGSDSLLFLGQHFREDSSPLPIMLRSLELSCSSEEFLTTLNERAKGNGSRIIIFIDALNEGNGKVIWKEYLAGIVEQLKQYPWLGLVVSIRTEYVKSLFAENQQLEKEFVKVRHQGFSSIEYKAIKKYFEHYNVLFNDIPFAEQEFRSPLFLRLLCEGFSGEYVNLSEISITDVYKRYLVSINQKISDICGYSRHINVVEKAINELVKYKYTAGIGNNLIPLDDAYEIISGIEQKYNINQAVFDELLSNGVITQSKRYDKYDYIYVTYEKLDDYLYAHLLVNDLEYIGEDKFREKYLGIQNYGDILEALAIVLSERSKFELFELFEGDTENVISGFCNSLKWRKAESISDITMEYINNNLLKYQYGFENLMEVLLLISTKIGHSLNADKTVDYILSYPMPARDAKFIPLFDKLFYEEGSAINRLIDWCYFDKTSTNTLDETIRLAAEVMVLFLISPNNVLRDKTTKALVSLLSGRIEILISILERYRDVDDPYILERLYAVAFGCVLSELQEKNIELLSRYTFDTIFNNKSVYPNMLLRDYAKSIVEHAIYIIPSFNISLADIEPPYSSRMPTVPSDKDVKKYRLDYKKPDFKDHYWSQNAILNSMKVEYDREGSPGGYGDFGRYTFQSYFSNWDGLDYIDLKNIAIQRIFDLGYDVDKHGEYDHKIMTNRFRKDKIERIGKKYQWIALYELAAQVADNYKMKYHTDCYGNTEEIFCKGAYEPSLRNIDPTALKCKKDIEDRMIHNKLYKIPANTNHEWLSGFDDFPEIKELVAMNYDNRDFALLNGSYIWPEEKELGEKRYQSGKKDMWIQINAYIVKDEAYETTVKALENKDFIGRWLSEPNDNYYLYNKEYYWSEAYKFFRNSYYCGEDWVILDDRGNLDVDDLSVLLPSSRYVTERDGDSTQNENSLAWYKPCGELFSGLNMKYGRDNSILYGSDNKVICFDSIELLSEDVGLFIDQEKFNTFLELNGYRFFWTLLAEKRIMGDSFRSLEKYCQPRISGLITVDDDGDFRSLLKSFE